MDFNYSGEALEQAVAAPTQGGVQDQVGASSLTRSSSNQYWSKSLQASVHTQSLRRGESNFQQYGIQTV